MHRLVKASKDWLIKLCILKHYIKKINLLAIKAAVKSERVENLKLPAFKIIPFQSCLSSHAFFFVILVTVKTLSRRSILPMRKFYNCYKKNLQMNHFWFKSVIILKSISSRELWTSLRSWQDFLLREILMKNSII